MSDVSRLRKLLRKKAPLPKDTHLKEIVGSRRMHLYQSRDQGDEREILKALISDDASEEEKAEAVRIANCLPPVPCGSWICYVCRHLRWKEIREEVGRLARNRRRRDISFLTVIGGVVRRKPRFAEEVIDEMSGTLLSVLGQWPGISVIGRFEIDWYSPGEQPTKGKVTTLQELGFRTSRRVQLVPHLHALVFHKGVPRDLIKLPLKRAFPATYQAELRMLKQDLPVPTSLSNLSRYPLKFNSLLAERPGVPYLKPSSRNLLRFYRLIDRLGGLRGQLDFVRFGHRRRK